MILKEREKWKDREAPTRSNIPRQVRPEKFVRDGPPAPAGRSGVHVHDQGEVLGVRLFGEPNVCDDALQM